MPKVMLALTMVSLASVIAIQNVKAEEISGDELKLMQRNFESRCARDAYMTPWEEIDIDMKKVASVLKSRGEASTCVAVGQKNTELERLERRQETALAQARLEEADRQKLERERLEEEKVRLNKEVLGKQAPQYLRKLDKLDFCKLYGNHLRSENIDEIGTVKDQASLFKNEAARRKVTFMSKLIREEKVLIGMTECDLYASWGYPQSENRSVGSWGVHIQHVYGDFGPYVYTENGRVTSFQD